MMPSSSTTARQHASDNRTASRRSLSDFYLPNGDLSVSEAEFDPRRSANAALTHRDVRVGNAGATTDSADADPWARYIATIEAGEAATAPESLDEDPAWPTLGIGTPTAPNAAEKNSATAATDSVPEPVSQPTGTPGLTIMRDVMPSEAATPTTTPAPMASARSRPEPPQQRAHTSAPSSRAAARRTHRSGGSKRGGSGSGVSSLLDKFRSGWGIAAGVVFLLIFGFILLTGGGGSTPSTEAIVAQDPGLSGSSTVNVMSAHAFQGAAVPVSSAAGPRTIDDVRASGFAHTELGAAMAALHLAVRTDPATSPAVFVPTIQEQTTGDTAGFLATRQKQYAALAKAAKVPAGQPIIAPTGSMVGWKIPAGWSADAPTTVHLLVQIPNSGKWVDIAPTVVWDATANDYKLQVSADGTLPSTTATPDGYTKFLQ